MNSHVLKNTIAILSLLLLPLAVRAQVNGEFRSAATGIWGTAATWEVYSTSSASWSAASAAPGSTTAIITVRTGHTITMGNNYSFKKLTVQAGGSVIADGTERRLDLAGDTSAIINNGNIGGPAGGSEVKLNIANAPTCTIGTISGTGTTSISRIRFNTSGSTGTNNSTLVIDMDMAVTSSGITAWYNHVNNTTAENGTITINAGRTVTMSGALHNSSNSFTTTGGNYTYNINGTLDMSGTTSTTYLYPLSNSASTITVNVSGVWKVGRLDAAYAGANTGNVVLNILNGGLVDASRAVTFSIGKWFNVSGTGKLKRAVAMASGAVNFPVGTSATAYSPVALTATTADDTVAVNVRNTLSNAIGDPTKIVNKQWEITPASGTGAGLTAEFKWLTADQAAAFNQSNPVSIFRYGTTTWSPVSVANAITGSGTIAAPYGATAATPPATLSGQYVVGNSDAQVVVIPTVSIAANPGSTACAGVNVTFTATTTNITGAHYQWKVDGSNVGTDANTYSSATLTTGKVVTCVISYTAGGAVVATSNAITMTINPLANAGTISGSASVCTGTTEQLTTTGSGGTWSSSNTALATVSATGVVSGLAVGNVNITYTATNSCGTVTATQPMAVTLGANAGTISGGTAPICPAATAALTSTMAGGSWSSNNPAVATVSSAGVVTGVAGGTATIAYVVVNGCGRDSAKKVITVSPAASAGTLSGASTVCVGAGTTLSSTVTGGTWSSSSANATVSAAGLVTGVTAGTAVITYSVTTSCGTATATRTMTISTVPAAGTITGPATVCQAATITLANTTSGGTWSNANPAVLSVTAAGVVTGIAPGTDVVTYTVTNTCGTASATKNIAVNSLPAATTITGADSVCVRGNTTFVAGSSDGIWSSATGGTIISSDGIVTGVRAGVDTVIYSITNPCGSAQARRVIAVWDCNPNSVSTLGNSLNLAVYPNPNNGIFEAKITSAVNEEVQFMVTDMMGSVIDRRTARTNERTAFALKPAAGIYFLNAVTARGRTVIKIHITE